VGRGRILRINAGLPEAEIVETIISVLDDGGLVVAPTETRYGLLARADKQIPAERLMDVKDRSTEKPIAVFVGSVQMIMHYGRLNPASQRLAGLFLPGPLTLVVPAIGHWHEMIVPKDRIGIRVSSSPVIQAIMERADYPVTATSANAAGDENNMRIDQISEALADRIDLYIEGGVLEGMPSTVVDCCEDAPRILREGAIEPDAIMSAVRGGGA
jgi:L-threonylcarbamoyladenylate synthase